MGQIRPIHSPASVCLSVCDDLFYSRNSQSILMKLCTVVSNPNVRLTLLGGQNPTINSFPSPYFLQFFHPPPRSALLMVRSQHHTKEACARIVAFDSLKGASRRPQYWRYWFFFGVSEFYWVSDICLNSKTNITLTMITNIGFENCGEMLRDSDSSCRRPVLENIITPSPTLLSLTQSPTHDYCCAIVSRYSIPETVSLSSL